VFSARDEGDAEDIRSFPSANGVSRNDAGASGRDAWPVKRRGASSSRETIEKKITCLAPEGRDAGMLEREVTADDERAMFVSDSPLNAIASRNVAVSLSEIRGTSYGVVWRTCTDRIALGK